jgi:hypothetical protein
MRSVFRILCALLIFITVFSLNMDTVKVYSEDNKLKVSIGENFGSTDNYISIPIDLSDLPEKGISAMNFVVEFDGNLVLNSVKPGGLVGTASDFTYYVRDNKVHILFSDSTSGEKPIKDSGTLCLLNFKIYGINSKNELTIKRIYSINEIAVDNNLNKVDMVFDEGKIIAKEKLYEAASDKVWNITFSHEVDPFSLRNNSIEVRDSKGVKIQSSFILTNSGKTVEVYPPDGGYDVYKSYTITIKASFLSTIGKNISKEQAINFYIKN